MWAVEVLKAGLEVYANSGATFSYLRENPRKVMLHKSYRDAVAIYKYSGHKSGFKKRNLGTGIIIAIKDVIKGTIVNGLRIIIEEYLKLRLVSSFEKDAK
jgi:hypothetical protein